MKTWLSGIVIFGLCIALTGCGLPVSEQAIEKNTEKKQVAMGRYIEETESIQDKLINCESLLPDQHNIILWESTQGKLQALIKGEKFTAYELSDEGEWKEIQLAWCQEINEKHPEIIEINFIKEVKNRPNEYVIAVTDNDNKSSALTGSVMTVKNNEIHYYDALKDIQFLNQESMDIDDNGNLYLCNQDTRTVQKINPEGEIEEEINTKGLTVSVLGDKLAVLGFEGVEIYNLNDLSLERTIDSVTSHSSRDPIFNNGKDAFFVPIREGLYRIDQSGEIVEQIIDGNLCALSSDWILQAMAYEDKFYMIFNSRLDTSIKVNRYTYKADEPSVPNKELVIWNIGLNPIEDMASMYREQHPDTYVKVEDIYDGTDNYYNNGCQIMPEDLDQLNTELLAGKGPDIIVLDSLNYEQYQKQGMFEDLTSDLNEWEKELPLLDNVVSSYCVNDMIYAIPLEFKVIRAIGDQSLIQDGFNFDKIADEQIKTRNKILYPEEIQNRVMLMLNYCQEQLLQEDGKINTEEMKNYLSRVKEVSVLDQQIGSAFAWRSDFYSLCGVKDNVVKADIIKIGSGRETQVLGWLEENVPDCMVTKKVEGKENIAEVETAIAINKNSKNKEGAKEFLHLGLTTKIQDTAMRSGLPVNVDSLQKELFPEFKQDSNDPYEKIVYFSTFKYEGNKLNYGDTIKFEYGYEKQMQDFMEACKTAQVIKPIDENIRKIIYDEALAYGKDEKSLDQAVQAIEKKVNLYLSEQGK